MKKIYNHLVLPVLLLLGCVLCLCLCVGLLISPFVMMAIGETIDTDDLYKNEKKYSKNVESFVSFPRNLYNVKNINYFFAYNDGFDNDFYILDASYDDIGFENELLRLDNILKRNTYYKDSIRYVDYKKMLYVDDGILFSCPTYIAKYNYRDKYEYVCIDYEEKKCIYVHIDNISYDYCYSHTKCLTINYLPINYENNWYEDTNDGYMYNISESKELGKWYN